jgi:hypothetical protein
MKNTPLPSNLLGLLQEHTAGGFLLVKIDGDGHVQNFLEYDNEMSYHAIMRKTALFMDAMQQVDEQMVLSSLFIPSIDDGEEDEGEEREGPDTENF